MKRGSGSDLVKMWLIGVAGVVAFLFAAAQVGANRDTPSGLIAGPLFEQLVPLMAWLGVIYGALLIVATTVYFVRRTRA